LEGLSPAGLGVLGRAKALFLYSLGTFGREFGKCLAVSLLLKVVEAETVAFSILVWKQEAMSASRGPIFKESFCSSILRMKSASSYFMVFISSSLLIY